MSNLQHEKLVKNSLEKLEALIAKAQKQKVDLRKLQSVRKRESFLKVDYKIKIVFALLFISTFYGSLSHLFSTEKV